MRLIPLGTAGFIPTKGKETASFLLINDKKSTAVLFDAGTGVKRLLNHKDELENIDTLNVVFSHFHHDHTGGLTWLVRLWTGRLVFHVPISPMVNFDGSDAIRKLTSDPFFGLPVYNWDNVDDIKTIEDENVSVGNLSVDCISQHHTGKSVGYRVGKFAYITDTEPTEKHIDFINGCDVVIMDTMFDEEGYEDLGLDYNQLSDHGYSTNNARIATRASINRLGLVHIDPLYSKQRVQSLLLECKSIFDNSFIPKEGDVYTIR